MSTIRTVVALALVGLTTVLGIAGTGLIFTAIADQEIGALAWGLPLTLGGLYWCGRALAQSQRSVRQRRIQRLRAQQG